MTTLDPHKTVQDWISTARLAGGIHHEEELEGTMRHVAELGIRFAGAEPGSHVPFQSIGSRLIWAYMVAASNQEQWPDDLSNCSTGADMQVAFGRLAEAQPNGQIRRELRYASRMRPRNFRLAMKAIRLL